MYKISKMPLAVDIGYVGETGFRKLEIDMKDWMRLMPEGVPSIVCIRPGETKADAYVAVTTFEDDVLTWVITAADIGTQEGEGEIQIWLEEEENSSVIKRGKSVKVKTRVNDAVNDPSPDTPTSQEAFIEQVTSLKTAAVNAKTAAETAQGKAEDAQEAAEAAQAAAEAVNLHPAYIDETTGHWMTWDTEEGDYVDSEVDAQGPQGDPGTDATPDLITKDYSDLTFPVAKDTLCYHSGLLYKANQDISTSEAWTAAHWTATTIEAEQTLLKTAIQGVENLKQVKPYADVINNITFNRNMAISNGYVITLSGNPSPERIVTDAISVVGLDKVTIKAKANWSCDFYAFYSSNDVLVAKKQCDSTSATIDTFNGEVEVPEGATKLYIAYITSSSTADPDVKLATGIVYYDINLNDYLVDKKDIENLEKYANLQNIVSSDLWDSNDLLNGYYTTEGTFTPDNTYRSCNFLDISHYEYVILTFSFYTNMPVIYDIWNENKVLLSGTRVNKTAGEDLVIRIDVGENDKYLTVNNRDTNNPVIIGYKESKAVNTIRKNLKGKKISFLGDSITTYAGYIPQGNENYYTGSNCGVSSVDQTWWKRIIDYCGMELLVNNSWSGATISSVRDSYAPGSSGIDRCESLNVNTTNPDIIIVYMGTNDFRNDVPLGSYDGSQTFPITGSSFREAVAIMLKKILTKYPTAMVYISTLKQFEHYGDVEGFPDKNGIDLTTDDYTKVILDMSTLFGVPVIDFNKCGLNYFNLEEYCGDYSSGKGLHPNAAGMKKLADRALHDIISDVS